MLAGFVVAAEFRKIVLLSFWAGAARRLTQEKFSEDTQGIVTR